MKKPKITWSSVKYWLALNLGILLMSAGTYYFKAPNRFATGGISGLAIVLEKFITPHVAWLGQAEITAIINVFLLIIGFIFLGKGCSLKTVYCTLVYSGEMELMKLIYPVTDPLTDELFLEFILMMLTTGAGSAIIFNCKASSGGTDIIALIIKKYTNLKDVGIALLVTDFAIAFSSFFVFGVKIGLFSMLGLFTKSFLIDGVIESILKSKYVLIITSHPETVAPFIIEGLHRSYTSLKAQGGYSGEERTVLMTVCKKMEAFKLKMKIHDVDPEAFVILCDTSDIMGRGWGTL
ncbi:MAG: YitT family protein [Clostridia bacterium]|nr:YitT family protein [Clostridia bacterium]